MPLVSVLFPDPPRRIPANRAISVTLRTVHLAAFGILLGGHVFAIDPPRLVPFLAATIASGAAMMALEMAHTCAWLVTVKGLAVVLKLLLLLTVPLFWDHRVSILLVTVVVSSVASHLPARHRNYRVLYRGAPALGPAIPPLDPRRTK